MKRLVLGLVFATAGCATAPAKKPSVVADKSLFERLGGLPAISATIDELRKCVSADSRINTYFATADRARLRAMLIEQLCEATGGPCRYGGKDMRTAHLGLNILERDFTAWVEDMGHALDNLKVGARERDELLAVLASMKGEVTGQ